MNGLCMVMVITALALLVPGQAVLAQGFEYVPPSPDAAASVAVPADNPTVPVAADPAVPAVNPYNVSGLVIDASAENAVVAREKAFSDALAAGFTQMTETLIPDIAARDRITPPTMADLGGMLLDFTTSNEQLNATRYTATYDLRFKPGMVQAYLGRFTNPSMTPAATTNAASVAPAASDSTMVTQVGAAYVPPAGLIPARKVEMHIRFVTLAQWQTVRANLMAVPGVRSVQIIALKTDMARVNVVYDGTEEALVAAVRARGLGIQLSPTSQTIATGETIYDVAMPSTGGM